MSTQAELMMELERRREQIQRLTGASDAQMHQLAYLANEAARHSPFITVEKVVDAQHALALVGFNVDGIVHQMANCLQFASACRVSFIEIAERLRNSMVVDGCGVNPFLQPHRIPSPEHGARARAPTDYMTYEVIHAVGGPDFLARPVAPMERPGFCGTLILGPGCPDELYTRVRSTPEARRGEYDVISVLCGDSVALPRAGTDQVDTVPLGRFRCQLGEFLAAWDPAPHGARGNGATERDIVIEYARGSDLAFLAGLLGVRRRADEPDRALRERIYGAMDRGATVPEFTPLGREFDCRSADPSGVVAEAPTTTNESGETLTCVFCDKPARIRAEGFAPECDECASQWED